MNYSYPMGIWGAFFPWQPKQRRLFQAAKALAATAAIQFANGNAITVSTNSASNNQKTFNNYLKFADAAIQQLAALKTQQ